MIDRNKIYIVLIMINLFIFFVIIDVFFFCMIFLNIVMLVNDVYVINIIELFLYIYWYY